MADNVTVDNAGLTDYTAATDKVTYSGDTADVQLMRPVFVTGAEGSKTVVDRVVTATLGALNDTIALATLGAEELHFTFLEAGDLVGTISIEGSYDNGSSYPFAVAAYDVLNHSWITSVDGATVQLDWTLLVSPHIHEYDGAGGFTNVRFRVSAYTSGAVDMRAHASATRSGYLGPVVMGNDSGDTQAAFTWAPGTVSHGFLFNGTQWTRLRGDATNGLDVDVTRLPALVAGTANIGDVDVLTVPAPLSTTGGGTEATAHRVTIASDSTGVLSVDDNGSSLTVDGTITASNTAGDVAHGTGDSGNPVKIGLKAANAFPTAEANADRVNAIGDLFGRQMTTHIDPAQQVWKSYNDTSSRSAGSAQVVWDPTSGKKIAVTSLVINAYGTTAGRIFLFFADDADLTYTAGTDQPLFVGSFAPSTTSKPGAVINFPHPVFCTTADRRIHYQNDAAISVDIVIYGYEW